MRAATGFDGLDTWGGQGVVASQKFCVFAWNKIRKEKKRKGKVGKYRVKMSFVTAAMLYCSRKALQRASISAVLPEPTGLFLLSAD